MSPEERDRGVDDMIDLVMAVDGILRVQATADVERRAAACGRTGCLPLAVYILGRRRTAFSEGIAQHDHRRSVPAYRIAVRSDVNDIG